MLQSRTIRKILLCAFFLALLWAAGSLFPDKTKLVSSVPQAAAREPGRVYLFAPAPLYRGEKDHIVPANITIQEGLLTVLKPPLESNGYTWLCIRDARGNEGWVYEHLTSSVPEAMDGGKTAAFGQERVDYYNALPHDYKPDDLIPLPMRYCRIRQIELRKEAAAAFIELHEAAAQTGLAIYGFSGYRSYAAQRELYLNRIRIGEKHRQCYVARPGHTEHQLGTVLDVVGNDVNLAAQNEFDRTPHAAWLRMECYRFGFVLSYGKDNTQPTGYAYESWHIRYIGKENARRWIREHIAPDNPIYKRYILKSKS